MAAERPFLIGLTGSIGMGKSQTAKLFARLGIAVYDADAAVHALYEAGGAAALAIGEAFPGTVANGRVNRAALAARVHGDPAALARLEAIVHPLLAGEERAFIEREAGAEFIVLDIPLLFETGAEARLDAVIVVSAPQEVQRARVLAREGMNQDRLEQILARQMPDAQKRAKADFVVETGKGLDHALRQLEDILAQLRRRRAEDAHA